MCADVPRCKIMGDTCEKSAGFRNWRWALLLWGFAAAPEAMLAQSTLEALRFGPGADPVGYVTGGIGWTFVPTANLSVQEIGFFSPGPQTIDLSIWQSTNQVIATYTMSSVGPPYQTTATYQSISPVLLTAGSAYAISLRDHSHSTVLFTICGRLGTTGTNGLCTFDLSPFLSGFANFQLTNDQWSASPSPPLNADYIFLGPTFRFEVVPEPTSLPLFILGSLILFYRRPGKPHHLKGINSA